MTALIPVDIAILVLVLAAITTLGRHVVVVPPHRSRVLAIACPVCHRLVKPRHYLVTARTCRDCAPPPAQGGQRCPERES